jgi:hypothetical protein
MPARARVRTRDVVIVGLLLLGLLSGIVLVITGGRTEPPEDPAAPRATLPEDTSMAALEDWAGLEFPEGTDEFLTARPGEGQLDVTFTMPADAEQRFIEGSGLPQLVPGERQVLHSSPLWRLNPGDGDGTAEGEGDGSIATTITTAPDSTDASTSSTTVPQPEIRGADDQVGDLRRAVEVLEESPGTLRARIVLVALG